MSPGTFRKRIVYPSAPTAAGAWKHPSPFPIHSDRNAFRISNYANDFVIVEGKRLANQRFDKHGRLLQAKGVFFSSPTENPLSA
jgi:hypothetical protein